jgi:exodeoxyribonuclease-5
MRADHFNSLRDYQTLRREERKTVEMKTVELTEEQRKAHDAIVDYFKASRGKEEPGFISMGGYAGTGKTTTTGAVMGTLRAEHDDKFRVALCAYTGKAASVLASKVEGMGPRDYCGTIHSLIYQPLVQENIVTGWKRRDSIPADVLIVDEASMVSEEIAGDLRRLKIPIVYVGDHGQLPPVNGNFSLMKDPVLKLEKIHRQAESSPIIQLSIRARKEGRLPFGGFGDGVSKIPYIKLVDTVLQNYKPDRLYLCGYNATRTFLNKVVRGAMNITATKPIKGDRVICLRNNRNLGIYNGMTGTMGDLEPADKDTYKATIKLDDRDTNFAGRISRYQFGQKATPQNWSTQKLGDLFDWAYAMTVHKAQGSEANHVVFVEERLPEVDDHFHARFLYTAVTRAKETLLIIGRART